MKKVIIFGEILLDNFINSGIKKIGGAPFNVYYHLRNIDNKIVVDFISKISNDYNGKVLYEFLKKYSIMPREDFFLIDNNTKTGEVKIYKKDEDVKYEILEDVSYDYIELTQNKIMMIKNEKYDLIYFGSLAIRSDVSLNTLINILEECDIPERFFDVNLRKPFYQKQILEVFLYYSTILKLNMQEFLEIKKFFLNDMLTKTKEDIHINLKLLSKKFNISIIILTNSKNKGYIYYSDDIIEFLPKNVDNFKDSVGCGDAFSAGFIYGYLNNFNIKKILNLSLFLSKKVCETEGALPEKKIYEDIINNRY